MSHIQSFKSIKSVFIDIIHTWYLPLGKVDISDSQLFDIFDMYEEGILAEGDLINDYEWKMSLFVLLSMIETAKYLEDDININCSDIPNLTKQDILLYVKALCQNINTLCYIYNKDDAFFGDGYGYNQSFDEVDFNRLVSKDITNPTKIMTHKLFESEMRSDSFDLNKEKLKVWLRERRYFKLILKGEYYNNTTLDEVTLDTNKNISPFYYIKEYLKGKSFMCNKLQEYIDIFNENDNFEDVLKNQSSLIKISMLLDVDLITLCSKAKAACDIKAAREKEEIEKKIVINENSNIDYLKVVKYILLNGGVYYDSISETKKITPLVFGKSALAIEKTKKVNVWINTQSLPDIKKYNFNTQYYEITGPSKKPYGRNSNLRKIPELAYSPLFKVKLSNGKELIELVEYLKNN